MRNRLILLLCLLTLQAWAATSLDRLDEASASITSQLEKHASIHEGTLAVLPFRDSSGRITEFGRLIADDIVDGLQDSAKFTMLDRQDFCQIFDEMRLNLAGATEPSSAVRLGHFLGAHYLVVGNAQKYGDGIVIVHARLIETETAKILASSKAEIESDAQMNALYTQAILQDPDCGRVASAAPTLANPPIVQETIPAPPRETATRTGTFETEVVPQAGPGGEFNAMAIDPWGRLHVVYTDSPGLRVWYTVHDAHGWKQPVLLGTGGGQVAVAVDATGEAHVVYWDNDLPGVRYDRTVHGRFGKLVNLYTSVSRNGADVSIRIGKDGYPVVAFGTWQDSALYITHKDRAGWSVPQMLAAGNGGSSVSAYLALDPSGLPHIAGTIPQNQGMDSPVRMWDKTPSGYWDITAPLRMGRAPKFAITQAGDTAMVAVDFSRRQLLFLSRVGSTWKPAEVITETRSNQCPITLDQNDKPHSAYFASEDGALMETSYDGEKWQSNVVDDQPGLGTGVVSLAVDRQGRRHLLYFDQAHNRLKHAWSSL